MTKTKDDVLNDIERTYQDIVWLCTDRQSLPVRSRGVDDELDLRSVAVGYAMGFADAEEGVSKHALLEMIHARCHGCFANIGEHESCDYCGVVYADPTQKKELHARVRAIIAELDEDQ